LFYFSPIDLDTKCNDQTPPAQVENLVAESGQNYIKLTWDSVECADTYVIYKDHYDSPTFVRGYPGGGPSISKYYYELVGEYGYPVERTSDTEFIDKRVEKGIEYEYRVVAVAGEYEKDMYATEAIEEGREGEWCPPVGVMLDE